MPQPANEPDGFNITLTRFHNNTGEFLDLALRSKVTLTKHGRPQWHITEASYLDRIEAIAAGNLLVALNRKHEYSADLDEAARARIIAQMPSDEEVANERWNS